MILSMMETVTDIVTDTIFLFLDIRYGGNTSNAEIVTYMLNVSYCILLLNNHICLVAIEIL